MTMNNLQKAVRWAFSKAVGFPPWSPRDPWPNGYGSILGLNETSSGIYVTGVSSLQSTAIWACCRVICQTMGSMGLHLFEQTPGGKRLATEHPLYRLLHDSPNSMMTSMEFREAMALAYCLYGNAFALKDLTGTKVTSLLPLRPDRMTVKIDNGNIVYEYKTGTTTKTYTPDEILHIRNFSIDGIIGLNPVEQCRHAIGLALAQQEFAGSVLKNGARPSGTLEHPSKVTPETAAKLRESWNAIYSGSANAGNVAVLWEGMKYNAIGLSPEDVQFIESRNLQTAEIARIWGVPLHMIAELSRSTNNNIEQQSLEFVRDTVRPMCVRWEQRFGKSLLTPKDVNIIVEFAIDDLMRGDLTAQATHFSSMTQNGIMSRNEARTRLGLNKSDQAGADDLTVQSNMLDLAQLSKLVATGQPAPAGGTQ